MRKYIKMADSHLRLANRAVRALWQKHPGLLLAIKLLTMFSLFGVLAWYKSYDPDFGWHLQAGNYIRDHGVPYLDIFTYTASHFQWINHEWLSDVFVSLVYNAFGYGALAVVYAAMWTAALTIAKAHKRFSIAIIAAIALTPYAGVRATTWTVLCLAILLWLVRANNRRVLAFIPPLMLFWTNVHGGFFIGLCVIAFFLVQKRTKQWLYILLLSIVASFINPYGPRLYVEIFRTLLDGSVRWQISEWFPAAFLLFAAPFIYSLIWAIGYVLGFDRRKWKQELLNLSPIFFLASLSSNRHFPLFVIASVTAIDASLQKVRSKIPKGLDWRRRAMLVSIPVIMALFITWDVYSLVYRFARYNNIHELSYPVRAVAYLRQTPCPGNIFNNYNFGGYLIWQLPGVPLYIDGRLPHWHDPNGTRYFDRYQKIVTDEDAVNSPDFQTYNIRCVLWSGDDETIPMLESLERSRWQKIETASDERYMLWVAPDLSLDKPVPKF